MTPKDKAIELHDKYYQVFEKLGIDNLPNNYAKEHAKICAKENLEMMKYINKYNDFPKIVQFWSDVITEISLL